jgi:hypothetical protein
MKCRFSEETEKELIRTLNVAIKQIKLDYPKSIENNERLRGMLEICSELECQQSRIEGYEIIREKINSFVRKAAIEADENARMR